MIKKTEVYRYIGQKIVGNLPCKTRIIDFQNIFSVVTISKIILIHLYKEREKRFSESKTQIFQLM